MINKSSPKPVTFFLLLILGFPFFTYAATDTDADGIPDTRDNCIDIANSNQYDSNNDGFGNACDADLDNNGLVSFADLNLFKSAFNTNNPDADFDGNGSVSFADLNIFKQLFNKPPGPAGSSPGSNLSRADASRFLAQSTYGPTYSDILHLVELGNYEDWLDEQFELSPTYHRPRIKTPVYDSRGELTGQYGRLDAWWDIAVSSKDQLRQRVAFALSEIMVISDFSDPLETHRDTVAEYYDILVKNSFGNFRDLLEDITLSPAMGVYLSMLGNDKPDPSTNRRADENYARELLQLFSIGLVELNLDGSTKKSRNKPIPTYNQTDIENLARIFTGWSWNLDYYTGGAWAWWDNHQVLIQPMVAFSEHHDFNEKTFLGNSFPADQSTRQDLDQALDIIFNHPNVGPFISKQLIMRLVTSNPSSAYVKRVAKIFNNDGQGTRGNMKAVVKAILMDQEARTSSSNHFGKLREPLLRLTHIWRAFKAKGSKPIAPWMPSFVNYVAFHYYWPESEFSQAPLRSPSVFNFFRPDFSPAGKIKKANLVAPEFQISSESRIQKLYSALITLIFDDGFHEYVPAKLNLTTETNLMKKPGELINRLDLILTSGNMSDGMRNILLNYINTNRSEINDDKRLVRDLIILITTSAEYAIQR